MDDKRMLVCPYCGKIYYGYYHGYDGQYPNQLCDKCSDIYNKGITGQYIQENQLK